MNAIINDIINKKEVAFLIDGHLSVDSLNYVSQLLFTFPFVSVIITCPNKLIAIPNIFRNRIINTSDQESQKYHNLNSIVVLADFKIVFSGDGQPNVETKNAIQFLMKSNAAIYCFHDPLILSGLKDLKQQRKLFQQVTETKLNMINYIRDLKVNNLVGTVDQSLHLIQWSVSRRNNLAADCYFLTAIPDDPDDNHTNEEAHLKAYPPPLSPSTTTTTTSSSGPAATTFLTLHSSPSNKSYNQSSNLLLSFIKQETKAYDEQVNKKSESSVESHSYSLTDLLLSSNFIDSNGFSKAYQDPHHLSKPIATATTTISTSISSTTVTTTNNNTTQELLGYKKGSIVIVNSNSHSSSTSNTTPTTRASTISSSKLKHGISDSSSQPTKSSTTTTTIHPGTGTGSGGGGGGGEIYGTRSTSRHKLENSQIINNNFITNPITSSTSRGKRQWSEVNKDTEEGKAVPSPINTSSSTSTTTFPAPATTRKKSLRLPPPPVGAVAVAVTDIRTTTLPPATERAMSTGSRGGHADVSPPRSHYKDSSDVSVTSRGQGLPNLHTPTVTSTVDQVMSSLTCPSPLLLPMLTYCPSAPRRRPTLNMLRQSERIAVIGESAIDQMWLRVSDASLLPDWCKQRLGLPYDSIAATTATTTTTHPAVSFANLAAWDFTTTTMMMSLTDQSNDLSDHYLTAEMKGHHNSQVTGSSSSSSSIVRNPSFSHSNNYRNIDNDDNNEQLSQQPVVNDDDDDDDDDAIDNDDDGEEDEEEEDNDPVGAEDGHERSRNQPLVTHRALSQQHGGREIDSDHHHHIPPLRPRSYQKVSSARRETVTSTTGRGITGRKNAPRGAHSAKRGGKREVSPAASDHHHHPTTMQKGKGKEKGLPPLGEDLDAAATLMNLNTRN